MGPRIALLLSGFDSDISAGVCAVQLAGRTEGRLYALQAGAAGQHRDDFRFVAEFAGLEGVEATSHLLGSGSVEQVGEFLLANSIACLVVGNWPEPSRQSQEEWLTQLRRHLREAPLRFEPELRVIMAPPLAESDFGRIFSQSRRLQKLAAKKT